MQVLRIPNRLRQELNHEPRLESATLGTIEALKPFIERDDLPLFPYYTDHGSDHVQGVLVTAEALIPEKSWTTVSAADCAVLVIAALLHDCGMGLSEDGFLDVVEGDFGNEGILVPEIDTQQWPELWEEFVYAARRWDDRTVQRIMGVADREPLRVEVPPSNTADWTLAHRLLAGEFVRRHHGRLSHEVALRGVPGPPGVDRLTLSTLFDEDLADLAGLIARSHTGSVRGLYDYLDGKYGLQEYREVHAVFDMVVLRISDYLQVEPNRAPKDRLRFRRILNPFSHLEWRAHDAVRDVNVQHADPESVVVKALPSDVKTFLRVTDWVGAFQQELDMSWAVLGEVYGRFDALANLGIRVRRVRSNLEEGNPALERLAFFPQRVFYDVARAELLQLMIGPLYGDEPGIGIRELMQNAVDAVRERLALSPGREDGERKDPRADVIIELRRPQGDQPGRLRVTDEGIGMTPNVVVNYFLRAGASYRASDAWRQTFEQHEAIDEPLSIVARSGRFGVGALAAFLISSELSVETRSVGSELGVRFTTTLEESAIQLDWDRTLPIGTTISVPLSEHIWQRLHHGYLTADGKYQAESQWDWFCWEWPSVLRIDDGSERRQRFIVPSDDEGAKALDWRSLEVSRFGPIYWTYDTEQPRLVVNGILVAEPSSFPSSLSDAHHLQVPTPNLSITDPDALLPLALKRDRLAAELPFRSQLVETVVDDCVSHLRSDLASTRIHRAFYSFPGMTFDGWWSQIGPWIVLEDGITLFTPNAIAALGIERIVLLSHKMGWGEPGGGVGDVERWEGEVLDTDHALAAIGLNQIKTTFVDDLKLCLLPGSSRLGWGESVVGARLFAPPSLKSVFDAARAPKYVREAISQQQDGTCTVLQAGVIPDSKPAVFRPSESWSKSAWPHWVVEWHLAPPLGETPLTEIERAWLKSVGGWKLNDA